MNKSIEDIYKGYLKKEFTPTEILNQYLDRINKVDKSLNSFTEIFETKVSFFHFSANKMKPLFLCYKYKVHINTFRLHA